MNEITFSSYSKTQRFNYFAVFSGKKISKSDSVDRKKSDACNVQSDPVLHCTQKVIMSRIAVQGLIHPKMKDLITRPMVLL